MEIGEAVGRYEQAAEGAGRGIPAADGTAYDHSDM